ncbi:methionyl-tRNA formyltransferase [Lachnospiraceae bacterium NE2001]|nr:methionyl-tRNA formyltransferase [Lachnospiraceae bacterium NE2001]
MRVVYMGTPDFAVRPLKKIYEAGHEIVGVYTQPDRQKGRGKKFLPSDVKVAAQELGLNVFQPERLREESVVEELRSLAPDVIVVAAYGQILSEDVLNIPKYGCINIHASLLPKYRGASPIEASIINGDEKTGVTIMYMAKGLDTGDMINKAEIEIGLHNTESLTVELSKLGADLIVKTIKELEDGTAKRIPQNDDESCYAGKLDKAMGEIDWTKSATEIERLVRGLYPWPCAYTTLDGKSIKLVSAEVVDVVDDSVDVGKVCEVTKKYFTIKCGEGALKIKTLQPEGKKPMDCVAFLNGNKVELGM